MPVWVAVTCGSGGFRKIRGTLLGIPIISTSILESTLGSPDFGKPPCSRLEKQVLSEPARQRQPLNEMPYQLWIIGSLGIGLEAYRAC